MQILNVSHTQWANAEHSSVDMMLETDSFGEIPFAASAEDVEYHGRDLFARAVAGEFGPIAEYVKPASAAYVPREISKAQGIAAMDEFQLGGGTLWQAVRGYFSTTASDTERDLFDAITVFDRQSPMLNALKGAFGLTEDDLDQLFISGSQKVI